MRFRKRMTEGYFTLEAAILVPLTFFLLACIIHMVFLEYGRCLLVQDAYVVALRASLLEEDRDRAAFAAENGAWQVKGRYFGNVTPSVSAEERGNDVTVRLSTSAVRSGFDLTDTSSWTSETSMRARYYHMPKHMRRVARIADLARAGLNRAAGESDRKNNRKQSE